MLQRGGCFSNWTYLLLIIILLIGIVILMPSSMPSTKETLLNGGVGHSIDNIGVPTRKNRSGK
jgi:hypothetical protein